MTQKSWFRVHTEQCRHKENNVLRYLYHVCSGHRHMLQCNLGRLVGFAKVQTAQKEQLKKKSIALIAEILYALKPYDFC